MDSLLGVKTYSYLSCLFASLVFMPILLTMGDNYVCNEELSCAFDDIYNEDRILCYGLHSCQEATLESLQGVGFPGSVSGYKALPKVVYDVTYSSHFMTARGYLSHAFGDDANGFSYDSVITCYGDSSCLGVNLLGSGALSYTCKGASACAHSLISLVPSSSTMDDVTVDLEGAFSFYNATLHTDGRDVTINAEGAFAGFGGTVICEPMDTCIINCYGNGCLNMDVTCEPQSICTINNCDDSITSASTSSGVVCPNVKYEDSTEGTDIVVIDSSTLADLVIEDYGSNDESIGGPGDYLEDLFSYIPRSYAYYEELVRNQASGRLNNELCSVTCDDYGECSSMSLSATDSSICCRAATGCKDGSSLTATLASNSEYDSNVICDGFQSCQKQTITASGNIYMGGTEAATGANAALYTYNNIYCLGTNTCSGTSATGTFNARYLFCSGSNACRRRDITNVTNIIASGLEALEESIVKSGNTGEIFSIYVTGRDATLNTVLTCYEDDKCYIFWGVTNTVQDAIDSFASLTCNGDAADPDYTDTQYDYGDGSVAINNCYFIPLAINGASLIPLTQFTPSPTPSPTMLPTETPTQLPTLPTQSPTQPTEIPTVVPTGEPSVSPTQIPTYKPSTSPTDRPTMLPTQLPSNQPTAEPTKSPSKIPSVAPTRLPTRTPTVQPSDQPSETPTRLPTRSPSDEPTLKPTDLPTIEPTSNPTFKPTVVPTDSPTPEPSAQPTAEPAINHCTETSQCAGEQISEGFVFCEGRSSCEQSTIVDAYQVFAYGYLSNSESVVTTDDMYAYGFQALASASVTTKNLQCYGYYCGYYSDIYARDGKLTVSMDGLYAGVGTDIYCEEGDTCELYCGSSRGCYSTTMYCYSGASCYYNCNNDPDHCPTLVGSGVAEVIEMGSGLNVAKSYADSRSEDEKKGNSLRKFGFNGLHSQSQFDLSDDEIDDISKARARKRQEKLEKEQKTGEVDSELLEDTVEYFEGKGERNARELAKELLKGPATEPVKNKFIYVAFCALCGALILLAIQIIYTKCTTKHNQLLRPNNNGTPYDYSVIG